MGSVLPLEFRNISCVNRIGFDIYGIDIIIENGKGVSIDWRGLPGRPTEIEEIPVSALPWPQNATDREHIPLYITVDPLDPIRKLQIEYRGHDDPSDAPGYVMMVTMSGRQLSILFSHNLAEITKPSRTNLPPAVCGMCGNYDTNAANDFLGKSFTNRGFLDTYLHKPLTPPACDPALNNIGGRKKRSTNDRAQETPVCTNVTGLALGKEKCAIINREDGPFGGECFKKNTQRTKMYAACVNDVCVHPMFLEDHLSALTSKCGRLEVEVGDWRTEMNLPFPCPSKMTYQRCVSKACVPTCRNTRPCEDENWKTTCSEGCVCNEGLIWDHVSSKCIEQEKCGTTDYKFPSNFEGLGGVLKRSSAFQCCSKTEEELAEMIYCKHGKWCFEPGARLVKSDRCNDVMDCMDNGKWNTTRLNGPQRNRDRSAQWELKKECLECGREEDCQDFTFQKSLNKKKGSKSGSSEENGEEESAGTCVDKEKGGGGKGTRNPGKSKKPTWSERLAHMEKIFGSKKHSDFHKGLGSGQVKPIKRKRVPPVLPCKALPPFAKQRRCNLGGYCVLKRSAFVGGKCQKRCVCTKAGKVECQSYPQPIAEKCMEDYNKPRKMGFRSAPFLVKYIRIFKKISELRKRKS
jgi:hypothetical protein